MRGIIELSGVKTLFLLTIVSLSIGGCASDGGSDSSSMNRDAMEVAENAEAMAEEALEIARRVERKAERMFEKALRK